MSLKQFYDKTVSIKAANGKRFKGKVVEYFYPEDNEINQESIALRDISSGDLIEFPEPDIKSIEIL